MIPISRINLCEWICIILGLLFITPTPAILRNDLCEPEDIDVFVEIDPSLKAKAADIFYLNCSNWGTLTPNLTFAKNVKDFFTIPLDTGVEPGMFVLTTDRSVPGDIYDTILTVNNGSTVLNLIPFRVTVEKTEVQINVFPVNEPFIINEKLPVNTIIAEFKVTSKHPFNRTVQTFGVPDVFNVSERIDDDGHIFVFMKSTLNIDTIRQREWCGCKETTVPCPYNLTCFHEFVKYDFSFKVESHVTPVIVTVRDVNDHVPVCPTGPSQKLREVVGGLFDFDPVCKDADYSIGTLRFEIIMESNCDGFRIVQGSDTPLLQIIEELITVDTPCQYHLNVHDDHYATTARMQLRYVLKAPRVHEVLVTVHGNLSCPAGLDNMQQTWREGSPGHFMSKTCPSDSVGTVQRFCSLDGTYEDPIYNCTTKAIQNILISILKVNVDEVNTTQALDELSEVTTTTIKRNGTLHLGDIEAVTKIMSKIADVINTSSSDLRNNTNNYIEVASNILSESTTSTWKSSIKEKKTGAETVIENIDRFTEKIATRDIEMEIPKPNLYLKIGKASKCASLLQFPTRGDSDNLPEWATNVPDSSKIPCNESYNSYSGILYKNLSKMMTSHSGIGSKDHQINAPIVSFSLYPKPNGTLHEPIEIVFGLYNQSLENPNCSYWSETEHTWTSDGCWLDSYNTNDNVVTCKCNHLTNFAILMSPSFRAVGVHHEALSVITIIGGIISMVCLVLTLIMFTLFWHYVKSVKTIIHINLSGCLFVSYLLFITGIDQTQDPGLCKAVAVMLHLFLVALFFIMLVEGLNIAYMVLKPMSTRKPGIPLLIGAYILSIIVVGISLAIGFDGYGGKRFCWLSIEHGLVWAFLGPAVFVCAANIVIIIVVFWKMFGTAAISKRTGGEKAKIALRNLCLLVPTMGLSWILGIFAINEGTMVFQYLFAILNGLQGVIIFVLHVLLNKKIQEAVKRRYTRWQSSRSVTSGSGATSRATLNQKSSTSTTKM